MHIYYPIDLLCLQNLHVYVLRIDVLCWKGRHLQYLMFYIIAWFYICLHLSTWSVCHEAFASQNLVPSMITTRASKSEPKTFHRCPPYLPICGISLPLQVNFSCAIFKTFKIIKHGLSSCFSSWGSSLEFIMSHVKQDSSLSLQPDEYGICAHFNI